MVIEMTKYSFILLEEETEGFLQKLQELGVVDITRSKKPVDSCSSAMMDKAAAQKKAISILDKVNYSEDPDMDSIKEAAGKAVLEDDLSAQTAQASARLAELGEKLSTAQRKAKDLMPWGKFDKAALDGLSALGYSVRFYTVSRKSFKEEWKNEYAIQVVSEDSSYVRFVTVADSTQEYSFPVGECAAPDGSYEDALAEAEELKKEIVGQKGLLLSLKGHTDEIRDEYSREITALDLYLAGAAGDARGIPVHVPRSDGQRAFTGRRGHRLRRRRGDRRLGEARRGDGAHGGRGQRLLRARRGGVRAGRRHNHAGGGGHAR